jgi:hypothetical protein
MHPAPFWGRDILLYEMNAAFFQNKGKNMNEI